NRFYNAENFGKLIGKMFIVMALHRMFDDLITLGAVGLASMPMTKEGAGSYKNVFLENLVLTVSSYFNNNAYKLTNFKINTSNKAVENFMINFKNISL